MPTLTSLRRWLLTAAATLSAAAASAQAPAAEATHCLLLPLSPARRLQAATLVGVLNNPTASSLVTASSIYRNGTHLTTSSALISATTRHTGLRSTFAHRSQSAFTTAPSARCTTPFSGPTHRIWLSDVRRAQVALEMGRAAQLST